ncbi:EAL domain-containing protein [Niallia nealsonii]|uniref:PAS domain S-box protein n=1 Tax=Niallia nealsonii TaxID=115979 RepID=A0A2N0Z7W2_9BACI|nr:EAL domain-containing protein [Niallia nealsonii]PKG25600.1 PAS domain S-box protein [Niallia nealsonii]
MKNSNSLKHKKKKKLTKNSFLTDKNDDYLLNKETIKALFRNHPDAVFILDGNGNLKNFSESIKRLFGYEEEDLNGDLGKCYAENYQHLRETYIRKVLNGEVQKFTADIYHKNGKKIHVEFNYFPIFNDLKQVIGIYGIAKDITENIQKEQELLKVKERLELAQQVAKIGSWDYDLIEDESYWSNQTFELYGIKSKKDFVPTYKKILSRIHPDDREYFDFTFKNAIKKRQSYNMEFRIMHADGNYIYVYEQADVILDENQLPVRFIGTIQDITKRKIAEIKLKETEQKLKNIYDNLEVGIWSYDVINNTFELASPGVEAVAGYTSKEIIERTWESIIHPEDLLEFNTLQKKLYLGESLHQNYRIVSKNGDIKWVQDQKIPVLDSEGKLLRIDGIVSGITKIKKAEEQIKHLAYHDYLTNLPNRRMFDEKMEELVNRFEINKTDFVIMYLDLDRFNNINDTLGHSIGDKLLQQFTVRVGGLLKDNSLFARIGGDEFGIILWGYEGSDFPVTVAKNIIDCMNKPFLIDDFELYITTSVGISTFPMNGETKENLIKSADAALHRAKEIGKNNYQIYSSLLNISSYKLYALERDLRKAIENNEFFLHFQPRVDASTGTIVSAEALLRWRHPEWGIVSPREFIPLAEENGLILEIGDWVFQQVCYFIKSWEQKKLSIIPISINISAQRFLKNDFIETVKKVLKETKINPKLIEFEITETTLIHHEEAVSSALQLLKEMGISIALDDFGTGYSSLTYLKQYPIDTIKIDRSFIRNISVFGKDEMIVKSIIFLAKGLQMKVVAEGVETNEQLSFLRQQECDEIQGYLFSKPVAEKEFQSLLNKTKLKPNSQLSKMDEMVDRRYESRIILQYPLSTKMSVTSIKDKKVNLGKTEVLVEELSFRGIRFLSAIDLPVRPEILLQFETKIMNEKVAMNGYVIWKQEMHDIYEYGLQFTFNKNDKEHITETLNNFLEQYRSNPLVPNCSFVKEDKIDYLMNFDL